MCQSIFFFFFFAFGINPWTKKTKLSVYWNLDALSLWFRLASVAFPVPLLSGAQFPVLGLFWNPFRSSPWTAKAREWGVKWFEEHLSSLKTILSHKLSCVLNCPLSIQTCSPAVLQPTLGDYICKFGCRPRKQEGICESGQC